VQEDDNEKQIAVGKYHAVAKELKKLLYIKPEKKNEESN